MPSTEAGAGMATSSSSRSNSETACSRFSGGFVKYTSAHRPMWDARSGLRSGFSVSASNLSARSGTGILRRREGIYDCTTGKIRLSNLAVQNPITQNLARPVVPAAKSLTGRAIGGFELILLRIPLGGQLALRRLLVKIGTGAVIERSLQVDPNLDIGIALVLRSIWRLRQPKTSQELVERREICVGGRLLAPVPPP